MAMPGHFVDANLLVLLVVGTAQRSLIGRHPRLKTYTTDDFDILVKLLDTGEKIYVTPNTLTETSNLLPFGKKGLRERFFKVLRFMIQESEEIVVASEQASTVAEFSRLGLTDSVLIDVACKETPVVTVDFDLYYAVASRDYRAAVHFNALRSQTY